MRNKLYSFFFSDEQQPNPHDEIWFYGGLAFIVLVPLIILIWR